MTVRAGEAISEPRQASGRTPSRQPARPGLSVVVVTHNAERTLARCLESVRWADEIVVVDDGSTDRTVEIARQAATSVLHRPWSGYADQKNFAIDQATREWVLILDADETVSTELRRDIARVLAADPPVAGYAIPRLEHYFGYPIRYTVGYPHWQRRLFRSGRARLLPRLVHETLEVDGTVGQLDGLLIHHANETVSGYLEKLNRYTSLEASELAGATGRVTWRDVMLRPLRYFVHCFARNRGYRDGLPGLIVSLMLAFYLFVVWVKVWELTREQ